MPIRTSEIPSDDYEEKEREQEINERQLLMYPDEEELDDEYDWEQEAQRQHAWAHQHLRQVIAVVKVQSIARMFLAKIYVIKNYGWWLGCSEEHEQDLLLVDQIMQEQRARMQAHSAEIQDLAENVVRTLFPPDLVTEALNEVQTYFTDAPE